MSKETDTTTDNQTTNGENGQVDDNDKSQDDEKDADNSDGEDADDAGSETDGEGEKGDNEDKTDDKKAKKPNWQQKRFGELTKARNDAQVLADNYKRQNEELLSKLAAKSSEKEDDGTVKRLSEDEINALAESKAQKMLEQAVAQREFATKAQAILNKGPKEFNDFDDSLSNLKNSFGDKWDAAVDYLVDGIDDAHKVIHFLGNDLDEANRILALSPARQIAEFKKIELEMNKPVQKTVKEVSKLANPINPVNDKSKHTTKLEDIKDTATWIKQRNAQIAARKKNNG